MSKPLSSVPSPSFDIKVRALILAAGRGSRLGDAAHEVPKCLLEIGRRTLIEHQIDALSDAGIGPTTMVVGYAASEIRESVGIRAEYVHNSRWDRTNSLYSFWLARERLTGPTVILNSDVLFDPRVLERLMAVEGDAFAIDSSSGQAREQMKVEIIDGRLADMRKDLPADRVHGENVGIIKLTAETVQELVAEAEKLVLSGMDKSWLGSAVRELAQRRPLTPVDVSDLPWVEIDFPNDLERARKQVWPRIAGLAKRGAGKRQRVALAAAVLGLCAVPFAVGAGLPNFKSDVAEASAPVAPAVSWAALRPVDPEARQVVLGPSSQSWWLVDAATTLEYEVPGSATLQLDTRLLDPVETGGHYVLDVSAGGERLGWFSQSTEPSGTWKLDAWTVGKRHRDTVEVPAGAHLLSVGLILPEGAQALLRVRRQELDTND